MNKKALHDLLVEIVPHLDHTRECGNDMTGKGDDCWCGIRFNHVMHGPGKAHRLLQERVAEAIAELKPTVKLKPRK